MRQLLVFLRLEQKIYNPERTVRARDSPEIEKEEKNLIK